jgi:hypothetical protein
MTFPRKTFAWSEICPEDIFPHFIKNPGKCQSGQMSLRSNFFRADVNPEKFHSWQMSSGQMSLRANIAPGKCHFRQISPGKCLTGKCHRTVLDSVNCNLKKSQKSTFSAAKELPLWQKYDPGLARTIVLVWLLQYQLILKLTVKIHWNIGPYS